MELTTEYYEYENKFYKVIKKIGYLSEYNYEYRAWFANLYLPDYTRVLYRGTKLESDEALDKLLRLIMVRELSK